MSLSLLSSSLWLTIAPPLRAESPTLSFLRPAVEGGSGERRMDEQQQGWAGVGGGRLIGAAEMLAKGAKG